MKTKLGADNLTEMTTNNIQGRWYLVKKGDECFAEQLIKEPHSNKPTRVLFKDYNGDILSLGTDESFARSWIQTKNEIDG